MVKYQSETRAAMSRAARLVPVAEADRIWRYGADADAVTLDKLDGSMVHSIILHGRVRLMTRKGFSEVALKAEAWRNLQMLIAGKTGETK